MSKFDKAIEYFDEAIRESDLIIADQCSPILKAELTEQKTYFETALAAMRELDMSGELKALDTAARTKTAEELLQAAYDQLVADCESCTAARSECKECVCFNLIDQIQVYLEQ